MEMFAALIITIPLWFIVRELEKLNKNK